MQSLPECQSATHRVVAWRRPSKQRALIINNKNENGNENDKNKDKFNAQQQRQSLNDNNSFLMETGYDDDGEKGGGKVLEKLLTDLDVVGVLVVARWFGGVLLGPVRFEHIRLSAREAVMAWLKERERGECSVKIKKVKVGADEDEDGERERERERERLLSTLPERDHSITILRDLLKEKSAPSSAVAATSEAKDAVAEKERKSTPTTTPTSTTTTTKTVVDYASLPLPTLAKLEHVRDATIGWILKQIEKAERESGGGKGGESPTLGID